MEFLYKKLENEFVHPQIEATAIPDCITNNLKFNPMREYQQEAFRRFLYYYALPKKQLPIHLAFNMATGSGKTNVMAGLMLFLYAKGYRNFLFFVDKTQIIEKTKDNFLNKKSNKYLFADNIIIEGRNVAIKIVENFDESDKDNINIKFSTCGKLHSDLTTIKENSISAEDFIKHKIVFIADEAHHLNAATKKTKDKEQKDNDLGWETTILALLSKNKENLMLEFTATIDYQNANIADKYKDKVIYRYDLKKFRDEGYSKDIYLLRRNCENEERMLQAMILNLYRQKLSAKYGLELKPVVLFKSNLKEKSKENEKIFHDLVDTLSYCA